MARNRAMRNWIFVCLLLMIETTGFGQHFHLNAGAAAPEQGTKLLFVNGSDFATNSLFIVNLQKDTNGTFGGEYFGGITFAALSADPLAPEPGHAAPGAFLELRLESVTGPSGGVVSFWQRNTEGGTERLFQTATGKGEGTNTFRLSESDATAGSDPYGHIHGRSFSATIPGLYTLGFRLLDTSMNGPANGPIHLQSDLFFVYYQAGPTLSIQREPDHSLMVIYPVTIGRTWTLERKNRVTDTDWQPLENLPGDNHLKLYSEQPAAGALYRLRGN
jgi:hypothetical protein